MAKLNPFSLPEPEDDSDRKLLSDIGEFGWHVVGIHEEENSPRFAFTVGLYYQYLHPEIMIMGLPHEVAHALLVSVQSITHKGGYIQPWSAVEEIASFPLVAVPIHFSHYKEHLGYGMWFYKSLPEPFPAIQLVWPDKAGVFPWQDGYDQRYFQLQRVLCEEQAL
ncbi:DUF4262 domain-containing protein [Massilia sp. W12]|uniref:DUF4262 domain-containing protein n=1 Tax=Massilia sp. W12 TaxID=3126507 RepID=UPI0030CAD519